MTAEDSAVISESPESLPHRITELEQKLSKTEEALRETTKGWSLEYEYVNIYIYIYEDMKLNNKTLYSQSKNM